MKRVKRIGVLQTSKVSAIMLFFVSLIFVIPIGLFGSLAGGAENNFPGFPIGGGLFLLILPILYGVLGFVMTAIYCWIYNLIANWTGGIELEFEVMDADPDIIG